ncbi:hypothetical protein BFJ63_vAg17555 [Fusarium oxysporum f. sp. narcissi]|uniref:Uncharacterized protein n=2 Tax=Fusarium oxysporum TaxID=5507 RepID=A0A420PHT1_FUSOX|nr:hypothetical protein NW765_016538 [Fusarium oxysporum]RKK36056.1 hypothetical protein BFJ67_g12981 [Fusarium oxysporum f. sp. cepae]RYC79563.1 hypothetical protein BFJ63_vAg17555 [Fusarium oxysporum f. sp. narcissi]KAJ4273470.1 hypothetical protein NW764_012015 [Fusarium oxysporum]RKK40123.1 hypothetical protein BFJ66_g11662 [Fusarium oxysporum f. sp. cepae]
MAVYNSSLESSEKGLEAYDLRDAEAFDSVEAMCKSDTVSLVVYAVAVFSHYDLISHSALGRADDLANPDADDVAKIIVMDQDQVIESDVTKTVDDYVSLQGWTESGVAFTYCFRGEGAFDKGEGLV